MEQQRAVASDRLLPAALVWVVVAVLVTPGGADCYVPKTLSYCSSLNGATITDRNFPDESIDEAAKLTAQMICNQDWVAGAMVLGGGEYGAGISDEVREVFVGWSGRTQRPSDIDRITADGLRESRARVPNSCSLVCVLRGDG